MHAHTHTHTHTHTHKPIYIQWINNRYYSEYAISASFGFSAWNQTNTRDIQSDKAQIKTNVQTPVQHLPHGTPASSSLPSNKAAKWITNSRASRFLCGRDLWSHNRVTLKCLFNFQLPQASQGGFTISSITRVHWHLLCINVTDIKVNMGRQP